jgi:predicted nucleotidyltransferase component of viral defense system
MKSWQYLHKDVMTNFLEFLNRVSKGYVLKGGTALLMCYGLDRFSEDIDLDGTDRDFFDLIERFCTQYGYEYRNAKDTASVKRAMVYYSGKEKPLKIEVSYRKAVIDTDETRIVSGILVYDINTIAVMKANAYSGRDKIRDLYDVVFIFREYGNKLDRMVLKLLRGAVEYKGIEQFDYVISEQKDDLIDSDKLCNDFLDMCSSLDLFVEAANPNRHEAYAEDEEEYDDTDDLEL